MRTTPRTLLAAVVLFAVAPLAHAHEAVDAMFAAATAYLNALTPEQKQKAVYPLTNAERENWNFVPIARNGLSFKETSTQVYTLGLALLRTGVSHSGMAKAQAVMQLEFVLKELEKASPRIERDATNYFVTIFGEPSADKTWGWRFEGHHLSFNFTIVNGQHVFFAPSFIGTNPAEVRVGPRKGERVLAEEEDLGHEFINSLTEAQRKVAIFADKGLNEIVTTNKKRVEMLTPVGIAAAQLNAAQKEKLMAVVKSFVNRYQTLLAEETIAEITQAGIDKITFAWAGALKRGEATYYRVQGPTFLIEFDNSQNNANHIHSTYREFKGDFGHDVLAEHYAKEHQK
ncbi:MAG: DUF3500 domain-containing protein [Opitutaceae bacterium]